MRLVCFRASYKDLKARPKALVPTLDLEFDVSIFKTFSVAEGIKAQFRAESLNVTNTPMFYGPNTSVSSNAFGTITSQANYPRLIQLGVRFFL